MATVLVGGMLIATVAFGWMFCEAARYARLWEEKGGRRQVSKEEFLYGRQADAVLEAARRRTLRAIIVMLAGLATAALGPLFVQMVWAHANQ